MNTFNVLEPLKKEKKTLSCATPQRPLLALDQLEISLSAGKVFACDRYVFVLLGSMWCRECPRRAPKSTTQGPSVRTHHRSLLEPQNPLTAPKWLLLLFFLCSSRLLINDHIQPLCGSWQAYGFLFLKSLMQRTTHYVELHLLPCSESAFATLCEQLKWSSAWC